MEFKKKLEDQYTTVGKIYPTYALLTNHKSQIFWHRTAFIRRVFFMNSDQKYSLRGVQKNCCFVNRRKSERMTQNVLGKTLER